MITFDTWNELIVQPYTIQCTYIDMVVRLCVFWERGKGCLVWYFFSEKLEKTVQAYEYEVMMSKEYSFRLVKFGFSGDWYGPWTSCLLIIFVESVWNHNGKFGLCLPHPPPQTETFPCSVCILIIFFIRIPTMCISFKLHQIWYSHIANRWNSHCI